MEPSSNVQITNKGVEEVAQRNFKLSIKKRSVLIQLSTPKTVLALLRNTVYPANEIDEVIQSLADEGFIAISSAVESEPAVLEPDKKIVQPSTFRYLSM